MARTQLIPQDEADQIFEKALSLGASAEDVMAEFESRNEAVTWSQVNRWRRDWEGRTGRRLSLTAPASLEEGDAQEALEALAAPPGASAAPEPSQPPIAPPAPRRRARKATAPARGPAAPVGWEILSWEAPDGTHVAFPVPTPWLDAIRDSLDKIRGSL